MREIILASKSEARQKLLKQVGLRFRVDDSSASTRESRVSGGRYRGLVVKNALRKAKNAARRYNKGIIIAADTVVIAGKRIVGKPKDAGDAFKTLKLFSKTPQWVYTGLAVIDIDNDKTYTDYERTKVYVCPLSDKQIKNYIKKVNPLDKAGSFDIQGLGGIFIDRIEGCFYNVVGLPLAKLAKILKKVNVDVL